YITITEDHSKDPVVVETTRVIRLAKYRVKEVIIAPEDQIKRVNTASGTAIAVEDGANRAVIVGEEADSSVLEDTEISQTFPVIRVHDNNTQQRVVDPRTGKYVIVE